MGSSSQLSLGKLLNVSSGFYEVWFKASSRTSAVQKQDLKLVLPEILRFFLLLSLLFYWRSSSSVQKKKKKKKFTSVFEHRHATVSRGSTHFGISERMFSPPSLGNYRRRDGVSRATDRSSIVRGVALRKPIWGKIRTVSDERCSSRCRAVCVYKWGRGKKVSLCRLSVKARGIVCLFVCAIVRKDEKQEVEKGDRGRAAVNHSRVSCCVLG